MTHLHLPDGALPWWLWAPGLALAAALLVAISRRHRHDRRDRLALLGTLGGLMLAAMSLPLGPLGYHLSLAPLVGMILGGGLAFVAGSVANLALALFGHGGITTVGLNALVTGAAAAVGGASFRRLAGRLPPFWAAALASAAGVLSSVGLWLLVVGVAGGVPNPGAAEHGQRMHEHGAAGSLAAVGAAAMSEQAGTRLARFALFSLPFWALGTVAEALVAGGAMGFLSRVSPALVAGLGGRAAARDPAEPETAARSPR